MNSKTAASVLAVLAAATAGARLYETYEDVEDERQAINWQVRAKGDLSKIDGAWFGKASAEEMDALLAEVKGAYDTDPLVATKISATSHAVAEKGVDVAKKWNDRLFAAAKRAHEEYAAAFMLQELRWCGTPDMADAIAEFGRNSSSKIVRDQAELTVKTLGGKWVPGYPLEVEEGFVSLFNGRDLTGWYGSEYYGVTADEPGVLQCLVDATGREGDGGNLLTEKEYANFILRFEVQLPRNANNGLGIRVPDEKVDAAYYGMCELQILDDGGDEFFDANGKMNKLEPYQYYGSIYGVVASRRDNTDKQIWGKDENFAGGGSYVRKPGMWNFAEVRVVGSEIEYYLNGYLITKGDVSKFRGDGDTPDAEPHPGLHRKRGHISWCGHGSNVKWKNIRIKELPDDAKMADVGEPGQDQEKAGAALVKDGFVPYFTGREGELVANWKGVTTEEGFDNPIVREAASKEKLAEMQAKADAEMVKHWTVRNSSLHFDGFKGGYSLATKKDYADFEMWADWRIMSITGDSGLYLRGTPQVQIWDAHNEWHIGSGGLFNNQKNPSKPLVLADRQVGDWNRFHIIMKGERVSVWLNGELVVDDVVLENYWDASKPVFERGQIELQCHGDPTEWRNVYIKEL